MPASAAPVSTINQAWATIAGAYERGFQVVVPREATAASNPAARQASLRHTDRYYGDVVPVSVVAEAWARASRQ